MLQYLRQTRNWKALISTLLLLTFCRDLFSERDFNNDSGLGSMTLGLRHRTDRLIPFFILWPDIPYYWIKDIIEFIDGGRKGFSRAHENPLSLSRNRKVTERRNRLLLSNALIWFKCWSRQKNIVSLLESSLAIVHSTRIKWIKVEQKRDFLPKMHYFI